MLFIHPQAIPELAKRLKGNGWLTNTIGLPTETTIALSHLIFEGRSTASPASRSFRRTGTGFCRPMPTDRTTPVSSTRRDAIRTSRSRKNRLNTSSSCISIH